MNEDDLKAIAELLDKKLDAKLDPIKDDVKSVKEEIKYMKIQQKEDHEILKALKHSSEVSKAERDKISVDIAHIQGDVNNINENIEVMKAILGRHEVDIGVLKRRPV